MPSQTARDRRLPEARALILGTENAVYLNTAAPGLVARQALDAAVHQIDARMHGVAEKGAMFAASGSISRRDSAGG